MLFCSCGIWTQTRDWDTQTLTSDLVCALNITQQSWTIEIKRSNISVSQQMKATLKLQEGRISSSRLIWWGLSLSSLSLLLLILLLLLLLSLSVSMTYDLTVFWRGRLHTAKWRLPFAVANKFQIFGDVAWQLWPVFVLALIYEFVSYVYDICLFASSVLVTNKRIQ